MRFGNSERAQPTHRFAWQATVFLISHSPDQNGHTPRKLPAETSLPTATSRFYAYQALIFYHITRNIAIAFCLAKHRTFACILYVIYAIHTKIPYSVIFFAIFTPFCIQNCVLCRKFFHQIPKKVFIFRIKSAIIYW